MCKFRDARIKKSIWERAEGEREIKFSTRVGIRGHGITESLAIRAFLFVNTV